MTASCFSDLLATGEFLVLPGVFDALSARIAARAGAKALYMTGFGVVGAGFAVPDIGLVGPEVMTERVRSIAGSAAPVPLVADGDNGFGGPNNVARLVRAYEQAGACTIQLEDQKLPKRCGHMAGKEVLPLDDAVANIRAACAARQSADFRIVARTDARAELGMDEALRRGEAFLKAGADLLFIEAPQSEAELAKIGSIFRHVPLVANMVEDGKTPWLSLDALRDLGYRVALFPITALLSNARHMESAYSAILGGRAQDVGRMTFNEFTDVVGLSDAVSFAERVRN